MVEVAEMRVIWARIGLAAELPLAFEICARAHISAVCTARLVQALRSRAPSRGIKCHTGQAMAAGDLRVVPGLTRHGLKFFVLIRAEMIGRAWVVS